MKYPSDESQKVFHPTDIFTWGGECEAEGPLVAQDRPVRCVVYGVESRAVLSCQAGALRFAQ